MDINEVPQDALEYKDRDKVRKLVYAVGKDGKYTGVESVGWEPENVAMHQAWEAIEEELAKTEQLVRAGELSPVAYFMQQKLMDLPLLAKYVGKWQWQVKRHFKPEIFAGLSPAMLQKYAATFGITVEELTKFGKTEQ